LHAQLLATIWLEPWTQVLNHTDEAFEGGTLFPQSSILVTREGKFEGSTGLRCSSEVYPDFYVIKSIIGKILLRNFQPLNKSQMYC